MERTPCVRHPARSKVIGQDGYVCSRCNTFVPKDKSKRGANANRAGRRQSWEIAKDIGGTNHEVEGKSYDVLTDLFAIQSKRGSGFPERIWKLLQSIVAPDGRIPVVMWRDAPGPGVKRRGVVAFRYEDWQALHGDTPGETA